jgi:hypothetical protein
MLQLSVGTDRGLFLHAISLIFYIPCKIQVLEIETEICKWGDGFHIYMICLTVIIQIKLYECRITFNQDNISGMQEKGTGAVKYIWANPELGYAYCRIFADPG